MGTACGKIRIFPYFLMPFEGFENIEKTICKDYPEYTEMYFNVLQDSYHVISHQLSKYIRLSYKFDY